MMVYKMVFNRLADAAAMWAGRRGKARVAAVAVAMLAWGVPAWSVPASNGFDYPVGPPDHTGYWIPSDAWDYLEDEGTGGPYHPGEDWNGKGGGNSDEGDPVYAVSHGTIVAARNYGRGWGNIVVIEHLLPDGTHVWSQYAHLKTIVRSSGDVTRGTQIGTIGRGYQNEYTAHLHFEIRKVSLAANYWPSGQTREQVAAKYHHPSAFIDSNRSLNPPPPDIGEGDVGQGSSHRNHFLDCFRRNGGQANVGQPIDGGGGVWAHWWGSGTRVVIQDFNGGAFGRGAIIDNEEVSHDTAYSVHGIIWQKYADMGGPDSVMHRPLSDEFEAAVSPQGTSGRLNRFEGGSIYWSSRFGAHPVYGEVGRFYEEQGGTAGGLGFPTSDPYAAGGLTVQDFEGGLLTERGTYACEWVSQSEYPQRMPGGQCDFWVKFRNVGTATWRNSEVAEVTLGVVDANENAQPNVAPFEKGPGLISDNRVRLEEATVAPGEIGTYRFSLILPSSASIGATWRTDWRLVAEGVTWFPKGRGCWWNVSIVANQAPNAPANLAPPDALLQRSREVTLSWSDGGDPDSGPKASRDYAVEIREPDGDLAPGGSSGWIAATTWKWTAPGDGSWTWDVRAGDGANESARTAKRTFTVDGTPPAVPAGISVSLSDPTRAVIAWEACTDALSGMHHYRMFRDGAEVGSTETTSFQDEGLTPGETYAYTVSAVDVAGNESAQSGSFTIYGIAGAVKTADGEGLAGVEVSTAGASATTGTDGTYTLSGLAAGDYTLTASKAEYTFSPESQKVTLGPSQAGVDFAATQNTYTVSGAIKATDGTGLEGVSVSTTGVSVTTASDGSYSLSGLVAGTYLISVSKSEYTFTPDTQDVSVGPNKEGVDFEATQNTYTVSGSVKGSTGAGLAGVTVSTSGASATTADDGSYTLSGLVAGSYTISVSKEEYTFSPASQEVTAGPSKDGVDFAATRNTYTVTGVVKTDVGDGLEGVTISAPGASTTTEADGSYTLTGLVSGDYTLAASKDEYTFDPPTLSVTLGASKTGADFTATRNTYTISGSVKVGGEALPGVTVSTTGASATSAPDGTYMLTGLVSGDYTLTASKEAYTFDPATVSVILGPDQTGADFTGIRNTYTISGVVRSDGQGLEGVTVSTDGATATTAADGTYTLAGLVAGDYTVTVSKEEYAFDPAAQDVTVGPDKEGADFTATRNTYTVSGVVKTGAGGLEGVTVSAEGATATTAADGTYTLTGLVSGDYTVTVSKDEYAFEPATAAVTLGPNKTGVDFQATQHTYAIRGSVKVDGTPLPGASVSTTGASATTGADGSYILSGLVAGDYEVAVSKEEYAFDPATQDVTVGPDKAGVDFTAKVNTYAISGTVKTGDGQGVDGASVSTTGATATTAADGTYTLSGLVKGPYTVTITKSEYTFSPASREVTVGPNQTDVDFAGRPTLHVVDAGLVTFGVGVGAGPLTPEQVGLVGDGVRVAAWDTVSGKYVFGQDIGQLQPGAGYWVKAGTSLPVGCSGTPVEGEFAIPLRAGWNLVSAPSRGSIRWEPQRLKARKGGLEKSLTDAAMSGWVKDYAWAWEQDNGDPSGGQYRLVYDTSVVAGAISEIVPWRAYWVKALQDCELVLPPGEAPSRVSPVAAAEGSWHVRLRVDARAGSDQVQVGDAGRGPVLEVASPPRSPLDTGGPRLAIVGPEPLSIAMTNARAGRHEWELLVEGGGTGAAGQDVRLRWGDLRGLPRDISLTLVDVTTGASRYLRTTSGYSYTATDGPRRFRLIAEPRSSAGLMVTGLSVNSSRGRARMVRFTLSRTAAVDVDLMTPTGRTVAAVTRGRVAKQGVNEVGWVGSVTPGLYLLRVIASAEDGASVQAVQPVVIVR